MRITTIEGLLDYLKDFNREEFTLDTETTGDDGDSALDIHTLDLVGVSLFDGVKPPAFVEMNFKGTYREKVQDPDNKRKKKEFLRNYVHTEAIPKEEALPVLAELINGARVVNHNGKYDKKVCKKFGIGDYTLIDDTMLMSYVYDCNTPNGLKQQAKMVLKIKMTTFEEATGQKAGNINWNKVDFEEFASYACDDAVCTHKLREHYTPLLLQNNLDFVYRKVELPIVDALVEMETRGVLIDVPILAGIEMDLVNDMAKLSEEIFDKAGCEFNLNSPTQLAGVLFDRLKLPVIKKTKAGGRSTDQDTLQELAYMGYDIATLLMEFSKLDTLLSSFARGIPQKLGKDGRLRANFNQTGTKTGRFSCSGPNLQNQPNNKKYPIRQAFIPTPGYGMIVGDWSTIEIRVLAHESNDSELKKILNEGRDIHQETTDRINGLTGLNLTRSDGKTINFAIIYRMGPESLAYTLNMGMQNMVREGKMTEEEYQSRKVSKQIAMNIIEGYYRSFAEFHGWSKAEVDMARANGFVRTFTGRMRRLPEYYIKGQEWKAVNQTVNTKIQGGAGELMKRAIYKLSEMFRERDFDAHLLMLVHDEFVIECRLDQIHECRDAVQECMETIWPQCSVPIKADVGCFWNWSGLKSGGGVIEKRTFIEDVLSGMLPIPIFT